MATSSIPQINLNRSVSTKSTKGIKVNPQNPMTKGQARLLFFAVRELTGARLDLFSVNTPALVHSQITELCGILKKDSGSSKEDQQLAIDVLVGDLRVPVLESSQRPVSSAGRAAAAKAPSVPVEEGKVGINKADTKPAKAKVKMTPAQSMAKARAAKKAKAAAAKAEPVKVEVASDAPSEKTADEKLALLVEGLSALIKVVG
tara:strand:- start:3226 stop:3834 length:609 start_codon:yes stop_codon:yes gene_type:complete